nr:hypothetical protein [Allomuricauda sp.]
MDTFLVRTLFWARKKGLLIRFTLGVRILLAIAFIPTGAVKLMGRRFTTGIPEEGSPLILFESLYQSGFYWQFIGFVQLLSGLLILFYRTSALGAILFLAIASNILLITISYDFGLTVVIASGITLASLWLVFWHWDRLRYLFLYDVASKPIVLNKPVIKSMFERAIYVVGLVCGLILFSMLRGLKLPGFAVYVALGGSILSFLLALILGIKNRNHGLNSTHP